MTSADPLGEALQFLRLTGLFYCQSALTSPWGLLMPAMPGCLWFHAVTEGACQLDAKPAGAVTLSRGHFAIVPHGHGHVLRSGPAVSTPDVRDVPQDMVNDRYARVRYGGGGAPTALVCGVVRLDQPAAQHLIRLLPPVICTDGSSGTRHAEWMTSTLQLIATEAEQLRPGSEAVITRLADLLVIQAIRAWVDGLRA